MITKEQWLNVPDSIKNFITDLLSDEPLEEQTKVAFQSLTVITENN